MSHLGGPGDGGEQSAAPQDQSHDLRLLLPAAAAWAAAWFAGGGVSVGIALSVGLMLLLCASAAALAYWRARLARLALPTLIACLVCAGGAWASATLRAAADAQGPVRALAADAATIRAEGVAVADPRRLPGSVHGTFRREDRWLVQVRLEVVQARGARTRVRSDVTAVLPASVDVEAVLPSVRLRLDGRLRAPPAARDGPLLSATDVQVLGPPSRVQRIAGSLRAGLRAGVADLPDDERGLLPGLVLGDVSRLPADLEEDFRTAGLTHLTAVSGANCAIVLAFALGLARQLRMRRRWEPALGLLVLAGFVVLARPQPSVLRAAVMGGLALLALASGRQRPALAALNATVLGLVLIDPALARSYGFALSALATAGICLWASRFGAALPRLPTWLSQPAGVALAAYLGCAPLLILLTPQISVWTVPANVLASALVPIATILGVLVTITWPLCPPVARLLGRLAGLPAKGLVGIAHLFAGLPLASIPWTPGLPGALLLALALAACIRVLPRVAGRPRLGAVLCACLVLVVSPPAPLRSWPPHDWILVACDVGQGDGLVLNAGPGAAVVVDAGPDPDSMDSCLRRLGIRTVPLLVLTHFHADHVEGVPGVLRHRRVGAIAVSPLAEPADQAQRVAQWANEAQTPIGTLRPGEERDVAGLRLRAVWPTHLLRTEESVANNASLVLQAERSGVRMLLLGDVEPDAQRELAEMRLPSVDVVKVAHHGSAYQSPDLMRALRPRVAVFSAGAGNDYGHPASRTLELARSAGAAVLRTDLDGDLAVVGSAQHLGTMVSGPRPR